MYSKDVKKVALEWSIDIIAVINTTLILNLVLTELVAEENHILQKFVFEQEQSKQKQFGSLVVHHTATEYSSSKGLPTPTEQPSFVLSVNANSNADEDREQSRQNHGNKYPRLNSHNVGSSPVEGKYVLSVE